MKGIVKGFLVFAICIILIVLIGQFFFSQASCNSLKGINSYISTSTGNEKMIQNPLTSYDKV